MAVSKTVYTGTKQEIRNVKTMSTSPLDFGRMESDVEKIFNTYKYWTPFTVSMQPTIEKTHQKSGKEDDPDTSEINGIGTKSLFNNINAVLPYQQYREDMNAPLLDSPDARNRMRQQSSCTIKDLVDASAKGKMGRQIYNYADFAYCKYLGRIPNNYLITLRRFPTPCGDKIDKRFYLNEDEKKMQNHMPDVGRLITWMGTPGNEMSNILKYTYGVNWEDMDADIKDVELNESPGVLGSIFNMSSGQYRKQVMQGMAGANFVGKGVMDRMLGGVGGFGDTPYPASTWQSMNADQNKIFGPIDVIDKTKKRKRGLNFEQKFTLTFDYELRSYGGVNGRAAMIDLLGNILAVTYTHGNFWGGERRFIGAAQSNAFTNLPIFKLASQGGLNNPSAVLDAFMDSVSMGATAFSNGVKGESTLDKIKNMAKDLGGMLLGGMLNKLGRPQKVPMASLLSGAPVGCWHLTVGNPKSPILEIGNLICTGAEIEHYGPLGNDDFPTGIRVKISLEHGMPRDVMRIEQMYGRGDTRIYSPMSGKVMDMYKSSESIKQTPSSASTNAINTEKKTEQIEAQSTQDTIQSTPNATEKKSTEESRSKQASSDSDIMNLYRYFGMEESSMITMAAQESLYGAEKRKNAGIKK